MPYLYSLFRETAQTGLPIMRPLVLEYPEDEMTHHLSDEFLVGRDVLVAPVYRAGESSRKVYFPRGNWVNYWTGERVRGGQNVLVEAPLDVLPLFIRAGAILPLAETDTDDGPSLMVNLYPDDVPSQSSFLLYEDDGCTLEHEKGAYTERELRLEVDADGIRFTSTILHQGYDEICEQVRLRIFKPDGSVQELEMV